MRDHRPLHALLRGRGTDGLAALCIALLFGATWLYLPRGATPLEQAPAVRVVLVDASASVRRLRPSWPAWARGTLKEEARAASAAGEEIAVVVFADEVRRVFGPGAPRALEDRLAGRAGAPLVPSQGSGEDDASRLLDALASARDLALAPERAPGRVVLLGAEPATDGDPNGLLAKLARRARLELRPLPACEKSDLALAGLELPATIEEGAPLSAVVTLRHTPGTDAARAGVLELEVFEAGALRLQRVPLDLGAWGGEQRLVVSIGAALPGLTRVNARVRFAEDDDPIPENDAATAVTSTRASRVVGVLTGAGARGLPGAPSGIERVDVSFEELPLLLPSLDALVALDVSHEELEAHVPAALLEAFVREGGGWLSTAGWRFLSGWTEAGAARGFQALLPFEPAPPEGGPRDVILLLDGSQSMEGEPFEAVRTAAVDLVEAAPKSDRVTLRFFTAGLQDALLLKERDAAEEGRAAGREAARALLSRAVPKGDTHLMKSLETLLERRPLDAPPALVILLSDGREMESPVRPFLERGAELRARLQERRVRVVPIVVGEQVELKYMRMLVPEEQPVVHVRDLDDLRSMFRREIGSARLVEAAAGELLPLRFLGAREGLAQEVLNGAAPPPLKRFVRARARAGADVAWGDEERAPVLALSRLGRGRVAMLTTALNVAWARPWLAPQRAGSEREAWVVLAPLVRWLARRPPRAELEPPRAWLEGARLRVRGLPPSPAPSLAARLAREGRAIALTLEAPLRSSAGGVAELSEREALLGAAARAELLAGAATGTATLLVTLPARAQERQEEARDDGQSGPEEVALSLALGPAPEFLGLGTAPDRIWFDAIGGPPASASAASAGERGPREARAALPQPGRERRSHPLAPWTLGLGLGALAFWAILLLRSRPRPAGHGGAPSGQGGRTFGR